jgi:hypothetical protein
MIMAAHGWWFPEEKPYGPDLSGTFRSNINMLIPMNANGQDGLGSPIKHMMCKVYKVKGDEQ